MDSVVEDYQESGAAIRQEYDVKSEYLSAKKLEYDIAFKDFSILVETTSNWTQSGWNEFLAEAYKKWQEVTTELKN